MALVEVAPDTMTVVRIYRMMDLIKQCDERFRALMSTGEITVSGFYSPRGQEAISAATCANLADSDYLVTTYRGLHDQLAKGTPVRELWAEYLGRSTGTCKGKGGSMHVTHPSTGMMVTTGIVGGGLPIATGLAWASQLKADGRVTVCNFGDGASNIGAFHESLNLASLWKLPVVFICQNNQIAEHTLYAEGTSVARVSDRAGGYDMPGVTIDGNDPIAVWTTTAQAIERARAGDGPTLIEALTFRFHGHNFGDPAVEIPPEMLADAIAHDPHPRFRAWLIENGHATEGEVAALEAEVAAQIDEAVEFAVASSPPGLEELETDVFASGVFE